jgi:poly(A) polymerase
MSITVEKLRKATRGTEYEGRLYLVGGYLRDRALGLPVSEDVDLVLEGDALKLAQFLYDKGLSDHAPVLYPRFGTAMIAINGHNVELVCARCESYDPANRKPQVRRATLKDDAFRRDFTINTLMENLHTGEVLDLTGRGWEHLRAGIIRTPLEPKETFHDDPLRMLRAVRFSARFGFEIEAETLRAIEHEALRLNLMGPGPPVVSAERIRDEFVKMIGMGNARTRNSYAYSAVQNPSTNTSAITSTNGTVIALELLRHSNLLAQFLPELLCMVGVSQNDWHLYDVWDHTLVAMGHLKPDSTLELRLGLLLHDIGKPATRTEDEKGVHFYEHQFVGATIAHNALTRLKFTNDQIRDVSSIVELHMRLGEARPEWSDTAIKRLIRATAQYVDILFELSRCDHAAMRQDVGATDLDALRARMDELNRLSNVVAIDSPLDGNEIMEALNVPPGPIIKEAKEFLVNEVIEGRVTDGDKVAGREKLMLWFRERRRK